MGGYEKENIEIRGNSLPKMKAKIVLLMLFFKNNKNREKGAKTKMRKRLLTMAMATVMTLSMGITSLAGTWEAEGERWKCKMEDGTYAANTWQWIDGNGDGVAECYYFDGNGYMLANTTTPDGYTVDANGAWVNGGVVQTQKTNTNTNIGNSNVSGVNHSAGYDPAHPLKNVIDQWDLRLTDTTYKTIVSNNVHAMLTGQMDQYFAPPVGDYVSPRGNHIYTTQEDYDEDRMLENALYEWFCNWLNGMDFENMSEMERAEEIQKVMAKVKYKRYETSTKYAYYHPLIDHEGDCFETAMTACSLAKALGLKSAVSGTGSHAVYYIQVDGVAYFGQDNELNLNTPTTDTVFCR